MSAYHSLGLTLPEMETAHYLLNPMLHEYLKAKLAQIVCLKADDVPASATDSAYLLRQAQQQGKIEMLSEIIAEHVDAAGKLAQ